MARPIKQGLDYFPLDVGFLGDIKVRKIRRACGPGAIAVLIYLLTNIYGDHGYYTEWDEDMCFLIADEFGVSERAVSEIVKKAIQAKFFDDHLYSAYKILSSRAIQKRFIHATKERTQVEIIKDYLLTELPKKDSDKKKQTEYRVIPLINEVIPGNNSEKPPGNSQSKEKDSKENNNDDDNAREEQNPISLFKYLEEKTNSILSTTAMMEMQGFLNDGIEPEVIMATIDKALDYGNPKWAYIKKIIDNNYAKGVKTLEDFKRNEQEWVNSKKAGGSGGSNQENSAPKGNGSDKRQGVAKQDDCSNNSAIPESQRLQQLIDKQGYALSGDDDKYDF